jgi:co-chaperonin GroES (HSP10)
MEPKTASEQAQEEKQRVLWGRQNQAKPGALNLPPLLEKRRDKYGIIDGAFAAQPVYDRVFVWQIPMEESETFGGGLIIKTERTKQMEHEEAPRGIIVGAGLKALDSLRSNGIDVGHIVSFVRLSPYRKPCGRGFRNLEEHVIILRAGDIIASEDLAEVAREGGIVTKRNDEGQHYYDGAGMPTVPVIPADY